MAKLEKTIAAAPCPRCQQRRAAPRPLTAGERAAWDALTDAERAEVGALAARMSVRCAACERVSFDPSCATDEERCRALVLLRRVIRAPFGGSASPPPTRVREAPERESFALHGAPPPAPPADRSHSVGSA